MLDDGGRILGLASVTRCVMLHRRRPVAILTALVVRGEVRGRGFGRRLVAEVETVARDWNCETVELTSRYGRRDAHDFYRSLGFESHSRKFAREVTTCSDAIRSLSSCSGERPSDRRLPARRAAVVLRRGSSWPPLRRQIQIGGVFDLAMATLFGHRRDATPPVIPVAVAEGVAALVRIGHVDRGRQPDRRPRPSGAHDGLAVILAIAGIQRGAHLSPPAVTW